MRGDEETAILQTIFINYQNRKSIAASYWKYKRMRTTEADLEADVLLSEWNDHNHRLSLLFQALDAFSDGASGGCQEGFGAPLKVVKEVLVLLWQ